MKNKIPVDSMLFIDYINFIIKTVLAKKSSIQKAVVPLFGR